MSLYQISPGALSESVAIEQKRVSAVIALLGVEIEPCEEAAILGLLNGAEPRDDSDSEIRWNIVRARQRSEDGYQVAERDMMLNGLYRTVREELSSAAD